MKKDGYWVIRTYTAGAVQEKTKFWIPGKRPEKGTGCKHRDALRQAAKNETNAVKRAARCINENFASNDLLLGLDYSDKGIAKLEKWMRRQGLDIEAMDEAQYLEALWHAADHEITNTLRRAKEWAKKLGLGEIKAFITTSDMDGKTGELERVHHHLVVNRKSKAAFVKAWEGMGGVDWETLWRWSKQVDRSDLAKYLVKQVRHVPDAKKYRTTQNMLHSKPKDRIAETDAELRVPRGGQLLYRKEFVKPGQCQYIRYLLPRHKWPDLCRDDEEQEE